MGGRGSSPETRPNSWGGRRTQRRCAEHGLPRGTASLFEPPGRAAPEAARHHGRCEHLQAGGGWGGGGWGGGLGWGVGGRHIAVSAARKGREVAAARSAHVTLRLNGAQGVGGWVQPDTISASPCCFVGHPRADPPCPFPLPLQTPGWPGCRPAGALPPCIAPEPHSLQGGSRGRGQRTGGLAGRPASRSALH